MEILGSLIIAISQSLLFYGRELGISVIVFTLIATGLIWYILYKKDKIVDKSAIILMIPILLLSSTYFIYGSSTFYITNIPVIIGLTLLMFRMATTEKSIMKELLLKCMQLPLELIEEIDSAIGTTVKAIKEAPKGKGKIAKESIIKIITSLIIVIIVVGIVIALLASADSIFASIFSGLGDIIEKINVDSISELILRIVICIVVYFIMLSLILAIQKHTTIDKKEKKSINTDKFTIKMLLIALNIVYLVFCYIQITSLFTKVNAPGTFNYAEYARSGFFQLMFVSFINFALLLISNHNNDKRDNFVKILNLFLIVFTIIIVLSSMYRMYMYETAYGLTYLRLLVYIILATELVLFVPTFVYVFTPKLDILKWAGIIGICVYVGINFANLENIIITRNLSRQNSNVEIDYEYISEIANSDSYILLEELLTDEKISNKDKLEIGKTLLDIVESSKEMKWQEFNISRYKIKDKEPEEIVDIEQLKAKVRIEELKAAEKFKEERVNYIYDKMVNDLEGYRVNQIDAVSGTAVWEIEKTIDGGMTYEVMNIRTVSTPSEIIFFENGLGFLTVPDNIYCKKSELYITHDSGRTFRKLDFPDGEFTLSDPEGKEWDECYDYFYLPTQEADGTLEILVSGGYKGGYNNGETRAKYISTNNGKTWEFDGEILK